MKKIYFISILIITIIFFNCSNPTVKEESSGNIVIQAPDLINPPNMSLMASTGAGAISQINTAALDQDNFRYQVTVESRGKRLAYAVLKRNDKKSISVIAGIPLDIYVSVYYAISRSSDDEKYNVFLATDSLTDFVIMNGESKKVALTLDITKKLPVDTYYNTTLFGSRGFANISGAVNAVSTFNVPEFSVCAYDNPNSILVSYSTNTFTNFGGGTGIASIIGYGLLTNVISDNSYPGSARPFWYIQKSIAANTGIYRSTFGQSTFAVITGAAPAGYENLLENISYVKNITFSTTNYYYFLVKNNGYFSLSITSMGALTNYKYNDTSNFNNTYPGDPFILDALIDSNNSAKGFLATKAGLFYVDDPTVLKYISGQLDQAINASNKLVKITDSSHNNILITKVADSASDKIIYLGTKKGIYHFNRNISDWLSFSNSNSSSLTTFNQNNISKLDLDEPVSYLKIFTNVNSNNILIAATPKRVYFFNITNGRKTSISIWDGLPFIPAYGSNLPGYNNLEYKVHDLAPVNEIIWDSYNSKFWIATDFGLASINLSNLNL